MALPTPEEVLAYQIQQENQGLISPAAVGTMGAAGGAALGVAAGSIPHAVGVGINRGLDAVAPHHPKTKGTKGAPAQSLKAVPRGRLLRPGFRMAGGLVGAVLGGGLGVGMREEMIRNSPEAAMLAKLQSGTYTINDQQQLEHLLEGTYQRMGVL